LWQGDTTPTLGMKIEGGDRMWLAPQLDVFDWDGENISTMQLPDGMDPGSWQSVTNGDQIEFEQTFLGSKMIRQISPLNSIKVKSTLPYCGYNIHDRVITEKYLSSWHLIMVPHPSDIFVHSAHSPVRYFGSPPSFNSGWISAESNTEAWKLGLSPDHSGKITIGAFSREDPGGLVVLIAFAEPNATYIDYPPDGSVGTAIQLFNSAGGGFCELEHHAPLETQTLKASVLGSWGNFQERLSFLNSLISENT